MKERPRAFSFATVVGGLVAWIAATSVLVGFAWSLWWQRDTVLLVARGDTTVDQLIQDRWEAITGHERPPPKPFRARKKATPTQVGATVLTAKKIRKWRGKFKPIAKGAGKTPAHWCPTDGRAIEYRIDPTNAKALGIRFKQEKREWRTAFDQWTRASGGRYTFKYAGKASFPIAHVLSGSGVLETKVESGSIAITYALPGNSDAGYEHPDLFEALAIGGIYSPVGTGMVIQRASVIVDASDLVLLDSDTRARLRAHEIGHAIGLQHVKHFDVLMRPGQLGPSSPQAGDVAGIHSLANTCSRSTGTAL